MNTRFDCPYCDKTLQAPEKKAGAHVTCPKCGQSVTVPPPLPGRSEAPVIVPTARLNQGRKVGLLTWVGIACSGVLLLVIAGAGLGLFGKKSPNGENDSVAPKKADPLANNQEKPKQLEGVTTTPKSQPTQKTPDSSPPATTKPAEPVDQWKELTRQMNDLTNWRVWTEKWRQDDRSIVGDGQANMGFVPRLPEDCVIQFKMTVMKGNRTRIHLDNDKIQFGNEGNGTTLFLYGPDTFEVNGSPYKYKHGQALTVKADVRGDRITVWVNGILTARGRRKTPSQLWFRLSVGDPSSLGTTLFSDFRVSANEK